MKQTINGGIMIGILIGKLITFFLIMAAGFALVKSRIIEHQDVRGLARITLYLIIPCVALRSFQVELTDAVLRGIWFSAGAAIATHVLLFALILPMRKILHFNEIEILSVIYPNAGNLTIPLVAAVLGWQYVIYVSSFLVIQQFLMWSHGRMLMLGECSWDWKKLFLNVNIIAILLGIIVLLTQFRFPLPIWDAICAVADLVGPVTMLVAGILLASTKIADLARYRKAYQVILLRIVVSPLLFVVLVKASGAATLIPDGVNILMVTLFSIVTPPATTLTLMAEVYHRDAIYANLLAVVATVLFLLTMPLIIAVYLA